MSGRFSVELKTLTSTARLSVRQILTAKGEGITYTTMPSLAARAGWLCLPWCRISGCLTA